MLGFEDIEKVAYYANAFDTTTNGVDIVATYPMQFAGGTTLWTFAGNYNQSEVTDINNPGAIYDDSLTQRDKRIPVGKNSAVVPIHADGRPQTGALAVPGPGLLVRRLYGVYDRR